MSQQQSQQRQNEIHEFFREDQKIGGVLQEPLFETVTEKTEEVIDKATETVEKAAE
jgi:hypothetical protein